MLLSYVIRKREAQRHEPAALVDRTHKHLVALPFQCNPADTLDKLCELFQELKVMMQGEDESSRVKAAEVAQEACRSGLLPAIVERLSDLEYECRLDAATVFGAIVRLDAGAQAPGLQFLLQHPEILTRLEEGYRDPDLALCCGRMLRDCIWHAPVAKLVLEGGLASELFELMQRLSNFEFASDALLTFRDLLTRHQSVVNDFFSAQYRGQLEGRSSQFVEGFKALCESSNFVMRWQALKLLADLLSNPSQEALRGKFLGDLGCLQYTMNTLNDDSRRMQYEAFRCFKEFVCNPARPLPITQILLLNRQQLLAFFEDFLEERVDEQFFADRKAVVREIAQLQPLPDG